ncbi:MAG: flagellar basal body P-ring protein FlgI [Methylococcaceae bacterium]|nr:flagellar basal body P-ring protein FlgI [Methylococcaceae bacterium]
MNKITFNIILLTFFVLTNTSNVSAERIKDLADIAGVRSNQLVGYGLVVGLNKTGDKTTFTGQSLRAMLSRLGINFPAGIDPKSKNIAAVAVSADLPAFVKPGQTIDVTVSSIGDAKSLRGGTLLMAPLKGADGQVYAVAQGNLVVGGLSASGEDGSSITINNPAVGRIASGATVERSVSSPFADGNVITFSLHSADFTTANRMVQAINRLLGEGTAIAADAASVRVSAPLDAGQRVTFASMVENIMVNPDDAPARIIVNSRTGTVVINNMVRVQPVAVSHGSLTVTVSENIQVSQPNAAAFGNAAGTTAVTPQSEVGITEENNHMFVFNPGVSLDEIVRAVNNVGASPSDLVAILEALKSAGALRAELIII